MADDHRSCPKCDSAKQSLTGLQLLYIRCRKVKSSETKSVTLETYSSHCVETIFISLEVSGLRVVEPLQQEQSPQALPDIQVLGSSDMKICVQVCTGQYTIWVWKLNNNYYWFHAGNFHITCKIDLLKWLIQLWKLVFNKFIYFLALYILITHNSQTVSSLQSYLPSYTIIWTL